MFLAYLPANAAYAFLIGPRDLPNRCIPTRVHDGAPLFFSSRDEAVEAANWQGFHVDHHGNLSVNDCCDEGGTCSSDLLTVHCGHAEPARVCGRHNRYGLTSVTFDRLTYRLAHEAPSATQLADDAVEYAKHVGTMADVSAAIIRGAR